MDPNPPNADPNPRNANPPNADPNPRNADPNPNEDWIGELFLEDIALDFFPNPEAILPGGGEIPGGGGDFFPNPAILPGGGEIPGWGGENPPQENQNLPAGGEIPGGGGENGGQENQNLPAGGEIGENGGQDYASSAGSHVAELPPPPLPPPPPPPIIVLGVTETRMVRELGSIVEALQQVAIVIVLSTTRSENLVDECSLNCKVFTEA